MRSRSLPPLRLLPARTSSTSLSAPGSARIGACPSSSIESSDVDDAGIDVQASLHRQPQDATPAPSLEEQIQQIFRQTASESSDTAPFTQASALLNLVNSAADSHDICTLLAHIPTSLLHDFVQLLRAVSIKVAMLAPDQLGEMARRALEHTANTAQAPTVWLVFSDLLSNKDLPIPAIHTLLGHLRATQNNMPIDEHVRTLYAKGQHAVTSAMERRAPALLDAIDTITTPEQLRNLLVDLTPEMLRFEPRLLLKLVPKLCNVAGQAPGLFDKATSTCLRACTGTPVEEAVWLSLCEQLQSPELSLPAARYLFISLRDAAKHLPSETARLAYHQATAHMNARNRQAESEARRLEQLHSTQFAHTRERSHSMPTLPSQVTRML